MFNFELLKYLIATIYSIFTFSNLNDNIVSKTKTYLEDDDDGQ